MPIQVGCGGCGRQYTVRDEWAGKTLRCKACGTAVRVPQAPPPAHDLLAHELGAGPPVSDPTTDLFGNLPSGETPLADLGPALSSVKPKKRRQSNLAPAGESILAFIRSDILNTAVAIGMVVVLLVLLGQLVTSGVSVALIPNAVMLVAGVVIMVGAMRKVRRNRDEVGSRTGRVAAWLGGGVTGLAVTIGAAVVAGKSGIPVPSISIVSTPFFLVFSIVILISGMLMAYNLLALMFPTMNVFRVAGWFYVFLTVVVPVLGVFASMALKSAGRQITHMQQEADEAIHEEFEQDQERMSQQMADMQRRSQLQMEAMKARSRPGGDSSFEGHVQSLRTRFGSERVAELHLEPVPPGKGQSIYKHIMDLSGVRDGASSVRGNQMTMALAPFDDLQALADRIDVGEVLNVDTKARIIQIKIDPAKL